MLASRRHLRLALSLALLALGAALTLATSQPRWDVTGSAELSWEEGQEVATLVFEASPEAIAGAEELTIALEAEGEQGRAALDSEWTASATADDIELGKGPLQLEGSFEGVVRGSLRGATVIECEGCALIITLERTGGLPALNSTVEVTLTGVGEDPGGVEPELSKAE